MQSQNLIKEKIQAPDFELTDTKGRSIRLSDFQGKKNVVLVLLRGFI